MKKAIIALAVIMAVVAAWIAFFPGKNPFKKLIKTGGDSAATSSQTKNTVTPTIFAPTASADDRAGFPLAQGSRGQYVTFMQAALNKKYGAGLVVDGIFGPKTYAAIKAAGYNADSVSYDDYKNIIG